MPTVKVNHLVYDLETNNNVLPVLDITLPALARSTYLPCPESMLNPGQPHL